jgi:DNA modification methylase
MEVNKIYQGDCLEVMKTFEDQSVNHICTDLPYMQIAKDKWDNQWVDEQHYLSWVESIILEYKRIIKPNGNLFIFTGRQLNRKIATILDKYFVENRIIIWARKRQFNTTRGKALASGYEPICFYSNGTNNVFNNLKIKIESKRKEYNEGTLKDGITLSDVWADIPALPHNSKEKLNHSTQKPYKLIERIILLGTNENDIILDSCAGSGTVGEVCKNNNRNFILIEKEAEYVEIIKERLI